MITPISRLSGFMYRHAFKPLMFLTSTPDKAHSIIAKLGVFYQKIPFARRSVRGLWAYTNPCLEQTIAGVHYANPVGLSAGFDKNVELVPTMQSIGFGFMTGGSVTYEACNGNPRPWFYRLPESKSLVVHVGLANEGAKWIRARIRTYLPYKKSRFPLAISVAKTNSPGTCTDKEAIADYVGSLQLLKNEQQISSFEINISCPNTYGGEPFTTPERLGALLSAVDKLKLKKPVVVKMPIDLQWKQFDALLTVIIKHEIAGVTIANLRKDRSGAQLADPLPDTIKGNLSGLPTQKLSDELISKTYQKYGDKLIIIGVGGIFTAQDAYRKITLGASLVGLVTSLIYEGPSVIGEINRELAKLLKQDGYNNIHDAIGSVHKK